MKRTLTVLAVAALVGGLATTPVTQAAAAQPSTGTIDAYLAEAWESTGVPGFSAVVTHHDRVVHAAGYGHDAEGNPVTEHTPMRVASLSKSFTATAVLTLVDDGRVKLDEPVATYLPEFRMADDRAGRITVRQLLNQTSGLSDTGVDITSAEEATSLREYVAALSDGTLAADPGTRWEYCNVNYELAARVVEVAGGQPFGDYLREHVFTPLGMSGSAVDVADVVPAEGHISLFGLWWARQEPEQFLDNGGAGGVITTADDLGRWLVSQNGHGPSILTPGSLAESHRPVTDAAYPMGWGTQRIGDDDLLVHSGNLFTYTAVQAVDPETGWGFAVLVNGAGLYDDAYEVLAGLVELSRGANPEIPGGDRQVVELVLGLLALAAVVLGVLGVLRARRWAAARSAGNRWWLGARLVGVSVPLVVFAAYPDLASVLMNGRTVTWDQLMYSALPLTVLLGLGGVASAATLVARAAALRSVGSVR
ncbi:serine hydrolase domain-containing protein [Saccharomonospora xinjiangensis]|uniref:serine hydrolase domain-containing protein n=1 Tax=Saccharomonospora xinjiangensis TaxID=75294 RepID=UPI00106F7F01|nr:serine hydrolase domain-containing protein [Saccharomonospora xinjiangensis]QBQ60991.1 Putative penicillin-binding protein PbpX [Saccharomonospora xinjiangensis]